MRQDKVLIVGADGLIGRALATDWPEKVVLETTRHPETLAENRILLDLGQDVSQWQPPPGISVALLCAAVTSLDRCRREPEQSALINVQRPLILAQKLAASGAFVVFLSTNLVFDGQVSHQKAEDPPCPQTEYGRQKAEAERQLLALGTSIAIVRLTKVLGPRPGLLQGWLQALQEGKVIHPFSDMVMAPIPLTIVVEALRRLAEVRQPGIIQISGMTDVTYADVAYHIAQRIEANPELVQPGSTREANLNLEAVPCYTSLDTTQFQQTLNLKPPEIWSTIDMAMNL